MKEQQSVEVSIIAGPGHAEVTICIGGHTIIEHLSRVPIAPQTLPLYGHLVPSAARAITGREDV